MTASFLILGILPFMHQAVFPSPIVIFTLLAIVTHMSLMDGCHFLGTVLFYKHFPLVRIPMATANVTQVKYITSVCCPTMSRLAVVFPLHDQLDKQTSDVCRKSAPSTMPPGQVHESWDHDHNAQAHLWKMYSITNIKQTIQ